MAPTAPELSSCDAGVHGSLSSASKVDAENDAVMASSFSSNAFIWVVSLLVNEVCRNGWSWQCVL